MEKQRKQQENDSRPKRIVVTSANEKENMRLTDRKRKENKAIKTSLGGF